MIDYLSQVMLILALELFTAAVTLWLLWRGCVWVARAQLRRLARRQLVDSLTQATPST